MRVFFGKISKEFEPSQISEGYYRAKKGSTWFNGIDVGDYCFLIGGDKIQLWKAKEWTQRKEERFIGSERSDEILKFDIIYSDLGIDTIKLTSFIYFKITMHLIIFPVRSAGKAGKAFFPISLEESLTEEILTDLSTYKNRANYRKIKILTNLDKVIDSSKDIQIYNSPGGWKIFKGNFMEGDPFSYFKDNTLFIGSGQKNKDTTLKFVTDIKNWDKDIDSSQLSILSIYDAFCCDYKQKTEADKLNYWVLGAMVSNTDKTEDYLREGVWINGYSELDEATHARKSIERVKLVEVGDYVAIKSAFVKEKKISTIRIKAIGKVLENMNDGKQLKVDWLFSGPSFDIEGVKYMETIHQVTDEEDQKIIFHNNYQTVRKASVVQSAISSSNEKHIPLAKNLIFFGPPGTGKTYKLLEMQALFTGRKENEKNQIKEFISNLSWWEVIAISLADIGEAVSVSDLQKHRFIQEKISQSKIDKARPANVLWANLQLHAVEDSKTVNVTKKQVPLIFDKNKDTKWYLVDNWKEQGSDLNDYLEQYKLGQHKALKNKRYRMVTFHQSYSYEDFVEGIRPKFDGTSSEIEYEIKKGVFREICEEAENHPDEEFAIFIDEINRGNISKIFGELITLIEEDKRLEAKNEVILELPYSHIEFGVPSNLYIIGTMNSVDRSVALVDMALRRRFEFKSMRPLVDKVDNEQSIKEVNLKSVFTKLNQKIAVVLGSEYELGHSYFMNENVKTLEALKTTWFSKVLPLLQEYLFEDWEKLSVLVGDFVTEAKKVEGLERLSLPNDSIRAFISDEISLDDFIILLKRLE